MENFIIAGGSVGTLVVAGFIFMWVVDGIKAALAVTGMVLTFLLIAMGIVLFWTWIAGGLS